MRRDIFCRMWDMNDKNNTTKTVASAMFREVFVALADELDCKKSQVPAYLGISYDIFIKIYELGKIPRPQILARIADKFNCSVEFLLGRTKDQSFERSQKNASFTERLTELENRYGKTDYYVSSKLHVSTNYITNWRKKNYTPSFDILLTIADLFSTSLDYLLGRTDDSEPYEIVLDWN